MHVYKQHYYSYFTTYLSFARQNEWFWYEYLSIFHGRSFTTCIASVSFVSRMTACVFVLMSNHWVWISRIFIITFASRIRAVSFSALCTLVSLTSMTCGTGRHDCSLFFFFFLSFVVLLFEKCVRERVSKNPKRYLFFLERSFFISRKIFFSTTSRHVTTKWRPGKIERRWW